MHKNNRDDVKMWRRGGRGWGRGRNQGQWPGRGPFSHLPPWQRPGWLYGPGSCWYLYRQGIVTTPDGEESDFPQFLGLNTCQSCNAPLLPSANFCAQCGEKIEIPTDQKSK